MKQYQTEIDNFISGLTTQLAKSLPEKDLSYNDFNGVILSFTNETELDAYLVAVTSMGVSLEHALTCANVFMMGRWPQILSLANNL